MASVQDMDDREEDGRARDYKKYQQLGCGGMLTCREREREGEGGREREREGEGEGGRGRGRGREREREGEGGREREREGEGGRGEGEGGNEGYQWYKFSGESNSLEEKKVAMGPLYWQ